MEGTVMNRTELARSLLDAECPEGLRSVAEEVCGGLPKQCETTFGVMLAVQVAKSMEGSTAAFKAVCEAAGIRGASEPEPKREEPKESVLSLVIENRKSRAAHPDRAASAVE
jgi:hypothetical protein